MNIETHLLEFIEKEAMIALEGNSAIDEAGKKDAEQDIAYNQLTKHERKQTKKALTKLLASPAGRRRLAAAISIAVKHVSGDL